MKNPPEFSGGFLLLSGCAGGQAAALFSEHAAHLEIIIFRAVIGSRRRRAFLLVCRVISSNAFFRIVLTIGVFSAGLGLTFRLILGKGAASRGGVSDS